MKLVEMIANPIKASIILILTAGSALAQVCTWTGAADPADGKWSTKANWANGVTPADVHADEVYVDGTGAVDGVLVNDLEGLSVGRLYLKGGNYTLTGKRITVTANTETVNKTETAGPVTLEAPIEFGSPDHIAGVVSVSDVDLNVNGEWSGDVLLSFSRGKFVLNCTNTYARGAYVYSNADVTMNCSRGFGAANTTVTFDHNLRFCGTGEYPYDFVCTDRGQFYWYFEPGATRPTGDFVFSGTISIPDSTGTWNFQRPQADGTHKIIFEKAIWAPQAKLQSNAPMAWTVEFRDAVTAAGTYCGYWANDLAPWYEFYKDACLTAVTPCRQIRVRAKADDVFTNHPPVIFNCNIEAGRAEGAYNAGIFDLDGHDLTMDRIEHEASYLTGLSGEFNSPSGTPTLRLEGTADATTTALVKDAISLVWAPKTTGLTQTFQNREQKTTGSITVTNGVFATTGTGSWKSVPQITVQKDGVFRLNTTQTEALAAVRKLTVDSDARFEIVSGAAPFAAETCSAVVGASGVIAMPDEAELLFLSVRYGDEQLAAGTYSGDPTAGNYRACFSGKGTVTVTSDGPASVWTGGAGDGKWSSAENWQDGVVPADSSIVELSNPGADAEIVNDIPGLTLCQLFLKGSRPLRLSGQAIAFVRPGMAILKTGTAAMTNALDVALPAGESVVRNEDTSGLVLSGAFSGGATAALRLETKLASRPVYNVNAADALINVAGTNTNGGGLTIANSGVVTVGSGAVPAGATLSVNGSMSIVGGGDFRCDIVNTASDAGAYVYLFCDTDKTYNFYGDLTAPSLTGVFRLASVAGVRNGVVNVYGTVDVPQAMFYQGFHESWKPSYFAPVKAWKIAGGDSYASAAAPACFYATNETAILAPCYSLPVVLCVPYAFKEPPIVRYDVYCGGDGTGSASGWMNLRGNDQAFDRLENDASKSKFGIIRSYGLDGKSTPATMHLKGTASAVTCAVLQDAVSVVWKPADANCVQTFSNRVSTTTGELIVSNGTLRVAAGAAFPNVKRIVVAAGARFELDTTVEKALQNVTNIVLAAGATFEVGGGARPLTDGKVLLDLASGSVFKLPSDETYDFLGIIRDGDPLDGGTYDHTTLPEIQGGSVIARDLPIATFDDTWVAGGADDGIATALNWEKGATTVSRLTGGALNATFAAAGTAATVSSDIDLNGIVFGGAAAAFDIVGDGKVTVRAGGITCGDAVTSVISAPLCARGDQTWTVGAGSRLTVSGLRSSRYGNEAILKDGPGDLYLNGEAGNVGPFTLGSTTKNGGSVYVNVGTNAFGTASDVHTVQINSVKESKDNQGAIVFLRSSVVERPFVLNGNNSYYNFTVREPAVVRFTKPFSSLGAMRNSIGARTQTIFEGGGNVGGWTCFQGGGDGSSRWIVRKTPITFDYLYMSAGTWVDFEVASNVVKGIDLCGSNITGVRALVPWALCTKAMRVYFNNAKATLDVTGDQTIGGFISMTGGKITSEIPSTVHFSQFDYSKNPAVEKPITNSAVVITGAVTLYKDEGGLFVQDAASDTTGGLGVAGGTLRMTSKAKFRKATQFLVEGTGRLEVDAAQLLGRRSVVRIDSTATLRLDGDQKVKELYVDGVRQPDGKYAATATGGATALSCLEGSGTLTVGGGVLLLVR